MTENNEMWAIIELMGHGQTAGLIKKSDLGGLLRVDVPMNDGYRTEYYGEQAIYAIRIVSEEIARAYALPDREICSYNQPIVSRAQYEEALAKANRLNSEMAHKISVLEERLTTVPSLPKPEKLIQEIKNPCPVCKNEWDPVNGPEECPHCGNDVPF